MILPQDVFIKHLKNLGVSSITICVRGFPKPSWRNPINRLLNYLIYKQDKYYLIDDVEQGNLILDYDGFQLIKKNKLGNYWGDLSFIKRKTKPNNIFNLPNELIDDLIKISKDFPIFVVDMRFFNLLYEEEKMSLLTQLMETLGIVRDYLLDDTLVLTNISKETLEKYAFKKSYFDLVDRIKPGFYNKYIDPEKTVILDPYGEEELDEKDIKRFKYFIIGGIVDKGNRLKGYTSKIRDIDVPHKKITLYNTLTGVPKEINHIVEIIVKVKLLGYTLEEAILSTQPKRYRKYMLQELNRRNP